MGHKVNATGFRIGVSLDWLSKWFGATKQDYRENLIDDVRIREYVNTAFKQAEVETININRTHTSIEVVVLVSRPGLAIGREGKLIEKAKKDLQELHKGKALELQIKGVKQPQLSARIIAKQIVDGIEKRRSVKSLVKRAREAALKAGVTGIRIWVAGRLTGGEHANIYKSAPAGRVPLHTLRAKLDYAYERAKGTKSGILSVKVWVYNGDVY